MFMIFSCVAGQLNADTLSGKTVTIYNDSGNISLDSCTSDDEIILGFPIWWYVAPTIVNTFLEKYNFSGKKIILFATSGGSGFGNTARELQTSAPDSVITEGKIFHNVVKQQIAEWVGTL